MKTMKHKLRYLPLFYDDLEQRAIYISETLNNHVVLEDGIGQKTMEVRRFLYNKENWQYLL